MKGGKILYTFRLSEFATSGRSFCYLSKAPKIRSFQQQAGPSKISSKQVIHPGSLGRILQLAFPQSPLVELYQTRQGLLIEEREQLISSGLGPHHPRLLKYNKIINGFTPSADQPVSEHDFLAKELTQTLQKQSALKQERKNLLGNGLGPQHPSILLMDEQLKDLVLMEETLQKQIRKTR